VPGRVVIAPKIAPRCPRNIGANAATTKAALAPFLTFPRPTNSNVTLSSGLDLSHGMIRQPCGNENELEPDGQTIKLWGSPAAFKSCTALPGEYNTIMCDLFIFTRIFRKIRIPTIFAIVPVAAVSCIPYHSSDFGAYTQFTDGTNFAVLFAKEADSALISLVPIPGSKVRAVVNEHDKAWVAYWNLDSLRVNQTNYPSKMIFLGDTFSDSQPRSFYPRDILLSGSMSFVIRDVSMENSDADRVAIYAIGNNQMHLLRSVGTEPPLNSLVNVPHTQTPPYFSRSSEYAFLRDPTPSIYSVSNLTRIRTIPQTLEFEQLQITRNRTILTDDLKYLVTIPSGKKPDFYDVADKAYCYDLDANQFSIKNIHFGTNQMLIVGAESIDGRLQFLAFWEFANPTGSEGFKYIGIFDEQSALIAEIPIELVPEGRHSFYLWLDWLWDYRHSRIFIYRERHLLTMYDYKNKVTRLFPMDCGKLSVP
jgi:hypothetical protein